VIQGVELEFPLRRALRVLALGAHCDDIEIGAGGLLATLAAGYALALTAAVLASTPVREQETRSALQALVTGPDVELDIRVRSYRNGYFPYVAADIKDYVESLKSIEPDLILTHFREDRHQGHRTVSEVTWNVFRSHLLLEYEIPKYDGDLGRPNTYVELSRDVVDRKCVDGPQKSGTQPLESKEYRVQPGDTLFISPPQG
jgi:LmbE family N-acetylglucosaminyl deacetylase